MLTKERIETQNPEERFVFGKNQTGVIRIFDTLRKLAMPINGNVSAFVNGSPLFKAQYAVEAGTEQVSFGSVASQINPKLLSFIQENMTWDDSSEATPVESPAAATATEDTVVKERLAATPEREVVVVDVGAATPSAATSIAGLIQRATPSAAPVVKEAAPVVKEAAPVVKEAAKPAVTAPKESMRREAAAATPRQPRAAKPAKESAYEVVQVYAVRSKVDGTIVGTALTKADAEAVIADLEKTHALNALRTKLADILPNVSEMSDEAVLRLVNLVREEA